MIGTFLNVAAILLGGLFGNLMGARLPEKLRQTVVVGLGLFTLAIGVQMFLKTHNSLVVLGSLILGTLVGELLQIEQGLQRLGQWLEARYARTQKVNENIDVAERQQRFIRGFLTASLLFCIGPMAILGSIEDGLTGNFNTLAIKSVLDCFAAIAFASSLGIGVLFSALPILVYQGGITLLAAQVQNIATPAMMNEMTSAGGVILMGIAIGSLLEIRPVRAGNFVPALFFAPLIVAILAWIGVAI